ncbi:GNAT family N-acetyltransferase [Phocaeicola sp.]
MILTEETFHALYNVRRLGKKEIIKSFNCGDADLNDFILRESSLYRQALLAVSYVVESKQDSSGVAAYFSLANDKVSLNDFESKTEFNRFRKHRFINEKRLKSYPAVKLCRLGVQAEAKGLHMGSFLIDFIKSYFVVDNKTGCRFLTVDAYADAIPFYLKNGFVPLNTEDADDETRLLYFDLATIADDEFDD